MQETLNRSNSNYDIYSGRIKVKQPISDKHSINYGGEWSLMKWQNWKVLLEAFGTMEYKNHDTRRQLTGNIKVKLADGAGGQASDTSISHPDTPICRRNLPTIWSAITTSGFHRSVSLSTNHRGITRSASELPPPDLLSVSSVGTSTISRAFSIRSVIRSYSLSTPIVLTYSVQWKDFMEMLRYTPSQTTPSQGIHEVPEDKPVRYVSTFMNFNKMQKYMAYLNWVTPSAAGV